MVSLVWVGVVFATLSASMVRIALAELQAPCAAGGAKGVLRSCVDFKKDLWVKLVGQYQKKWQEGIQAGVNPYEEGAKLTACNPFASELGLTSKDDSNRAFNAQPEDGDRCGIWGKITSSTPYGGTNRKAWNVTLYDPSREGAFWSGVTEVHLVVKALQKVLEDLENGSFQEPESVKNNPAIGEYKKLRQEVVGLGLSAEALEACKKSGQTGSGSIQKACYSAATGAGLEVLFMYVAEIAVGALRQEMTDKLRSLFLNNGRIDRNASDRFVDYAIKYCGRNKKGESCRQDKYRSHYLELLKAAVQQAVSQVTGK